MSAVRQAIAALAFVVLASGFSSTGLSQDAVKNRKPTLEERLSYGLRVRTADEKKFVKVVVQLVETGKLKQDVVDQAFFWVQKEIRKKKEGDVSAKKHIDKYPFFYFKQIVTLNAKRSGVLIR